MTLLYVAFYKGHADKWQHRLQDSLIRFFTRGAYSHCEIVWQHHNSIDEYVCITSSPRDGGVRRKLMPLSLHKWHLLPLVTRLDLTPTAAQSFYIQHWNKKYDWRGIINFILPVGHDRTRYFCSEFCAEFLGLNNPHRISPNDLYSILTSEE